MAKPNHHRWLQRAFDPLLATLLAAATAFALMAMPSDLIEQLVGTTGLPRIMPAAAAPLGETARMLLSGVAAAVAGGAAWTLLGLLGRAPRPQRSTLAAPESVPQLRRADAHPDAPARRPIFAARDLGTPVEPVFEPALVIDADTIDLETAPIGMPIGSEAELVDELPEAEPAVEEIDQDEAIEPEVEERAIENDQADDASQPASETEPLSVPALLERLEAGLRRLEALDGGLAEFPTELRSALQTMMPVRSAAG